MFYIYFNFVWFFFNYCDGSGKYILRLGYNNINLCLFNLFIVLLIFVKVNVLECFIIDLRYWKIYFSMIIFYLWMGNI